MRVRPVAGRAVVRRRRSYDRGTEGIDGPLRVQFHKPPGREGTRVHSGIVSRGAGAGWIRGSLRPAVARYPALDAGGNALLSEIDRLLEGFAPYSEERDAISTSLLGTSEILKSDAEGRVVLTDSLKSYAGITDQVTFVGHGHKFQIWEPETFRAHLDDAREKARELRRRIGARAGGATETPQ